jgi:hypothetical protein
MDHTWFEIVTEALQAGLKTSSGPVPGAKLRELVVKGARSRNIQYPPAGHEHESFGDFLRHFDSIVIVRRRKGRDLLAAPAEMPELLAEATESGETRLREDIFEAFTRIPRGVPPAEPWYAIADDKVVWLLPTELSGSGELVKIPAATLEQELSGRKSFIQTADILPEAKTQIAATLDTHAGLGAFSKLIKTHGLAQSWHRHRFQNVVRRIRAWCASTGVPWRESWISSTDVSGTVTQVGVEPNKKQRELFERFMDLLSEEELRRISVPLDIVLKVMKE